VIEIQRFHRRIAQLQEELLSMKKSRNWDCYLCQWAVSYFVDHSIPMS
jgi:hypothetical protein